MVAYNVLCAASQVSCALLVGGYIQGLIPGESYAEPCINIQAQDQEADVIMDGVVFDFTALDGAIISVYL